MVSRALCSPRWYRHSWLNSGLNASALSVVNTAATDYAGSAITGLDSQRSLSVSRRSAWKGQHIHGTAKSIIDTQLTGLIGVDTEEASVRLTTLLTQIETSYTITSRILNLSLVNYL